MLWKTGRRESATINFRNIAAHQILSSTVRVIIRSFKSTHNYIAVDCFAKCQLGIFVEISLVYITKTVHCFRIWTVVFHKCVYSSL